MKKYYNLDLDDIMEDLFYEMEKVQDGKNNHIISIEARDKSAAATKLAFRQ